MLIRRNKVFLLLSFAILPVLTHGCAGPTRRYSSPLMGAVLEVRMADRSTARAQQIYTEAVKQAQSWEKQLSFYSEESDISKINRKAGRNWVKVGPDVLAVVKDAVNYGAATGGAFDITVAPLLKLWGFYKGEGKRPEPAEIHEVLGLVGYRKIKLDEKTQTVFLAKPGMAIDLGGIAKGWAADGLTELLKERGIKEALVDLAGNMYALGPRTWRIGVKDPRDKSKVIAVLKLKNQAVATSGDYERYFILAGRRYCHIFDPRTGWPVDNGVVAVTIVAPTAAQADALSTSVFVLGPEKGLALVQKMPQVGVLIVTEDKSGHRRYVNNGYWDRLAENLF